MPLELLRHRSLMWKADFGNDLREHRVSHGLTQETLSFNAGLSVRYVQRLEAGEQQPTLETIFKLAYALHTSPTELITSTYVWWVKEGSGDLNED